MLLGFLLDPKGDKRVVYFTDPSKAQLDKSVCPDHEISLPPRRPPLFDRQQTTCNGRVHMV
jgi:hypothetical protein